MRRRAAADAGDLYAARLQLDHEEDQVPLETGQREHFDGKEVGSGEAGPMCQQERLPRRALTPLGGRVDPVVLQDPLHRVPGDLVTEVGKRTSDPRVTPLRILAGHSHHEVSDLSECRGAPSTSSRTTVVFLGDQPSVPAEDRARNDSPGLGRFSHLTGSGPLWPHQAARIVLHRLCNRSMDSYGTIGPECTTN